MKRGIDNGILLTDLDANFFVIRNLEAFTPTPPDLVATDDARMSDARHVLDGSVTNDSVADDAGIVQSKLSLSGNVPQNFLGPDGAAKGDLVQPLIGKNVINGYAGLGLDGKLGTGRTPVSGTGTLHQIDFQFPISEVTTMPKESGTTRLFTGYWAAQAPESYFGNMGGSSAPPTFDSQEFPVALIPNFDASRITSEQFTTDQMPIAKGVGVDHAPGLTPHPESTDTDLTAQPTDYLARDMTYKPMQVITPNQPQLPSPSITVQSYYLGMAYVNIAFSIAGAVLFYSTGSGFKEIFPSTLPLLVDAGITVEAYAAKTGFNNSNISSYTIPPDPGPPPT